MSDDNGIYRVGQWSGLPNYECLFCPFATLNEQEAIEHFASRHGPQMQPVEQPSGLVLVADKRGNEVRPEPDIVVVDGLGPVEVELVPVDAQETIEKLAPKKSTRKEK